MMTQTNFGLLTFFFFFTGLFNANMEAIQCDQIARFLKVLGDKIFNKSSQNERQLFVQFCKTSHSFVKTVAATVWATFGNVWATFYSNVWSQ